MTSLQEPLINVGNSWLEIFLFLFLSVWPAIKVRECHNWSLMTNSIDIHWSTVSLTIQSYLESKHQLWKKLFSDEKKKKSQRRRRLVAHTSPLRWQIATVERKILLTSLEKGKGQNRSPLSLQPPPQLTGTSGASAFASPYYLPLKFPFSLLPSIYQSIYLLYFVYLSTLPFSHLCLGFLLFVWNLSSE